MYIIHHVFLPPKLPQEDDEGAKRSTALTEELHKALIEFQSYATKDDCSLWKACANMVGNANELRSGAGGILTERLGEALHKMASGGTFSGSPLIK